MHRMGHLQEGSISSIDCNPFRAQATEWEHVHVSNRDWMPAHTNSDQKHMTSSVAGNLFYRLGTASFCTCR